MNILTTRLIAAGQLAAQGLLKYWQGKRAAEKQKKRIAREIADWLRNEQNQERVNREFRERIITRNPTTRIDITDLDETHKPKKAGKGTAESRRA